MVKLINIDVIDHLIITESEYTSFDIRNIMDELQKSGLFEIVDKEKIELQQWKIDVEREQEAIKIAKKMKVAGMDEKVIKQMTRLSLGKIRKL